MKKKKASLGTGRYQCLCLCRFEGYWEYEAHYKACSGVSRILNERPTMVKGKKAVKQAVIRK